jgi:hypothetical protein
MSPVRRPNQSIFEQKEREEREDLLKRGFDTSFFGVFANFAIFL